MKQASCLLCNSILKCIVSPDQCRKEMRMAFWCAGAFVLWVRWHRWHQYATYDLSMVNEILTRWGESGHFILVMFLYACKMYVELSSFRPKSYTENEPQRVCWRNEERWRMTTPGENSTHTTKPSSAIGRSKGFVARLLRRGCALASRMLWSAMRKQTTICNFAVRRVALNQQKSPEQGPLLSQLATQAQTSKFGSHNTYLWYGEIEEYTRYIW